MMKRSLYQCFEAKVNGEEIYCAKKHVLDSRIDDGTISIRRLERGEPLEMTVCQKCKDYNRMGEPIPRNEMGWWDNQDPNSQEA